MLHRSASTAVWWPKRWPTWQRSLQASFNLALVRYLLVLVGLCTLGCIYIWQANDLSQLHSEIMRLEWQASNLEAENMRLAQQSAQWNAPNYIEQRMQEEGFVDAQSVVYTRLPLDPTTADQPATASTQQLAQSPGAQ